MTTKESITQLFVQTVGLPLECLTPPKCIIKISMRIPPNSLLLCAVFCFDAVNLRWVPEHREIEGNKKADQLVKDGVKTFYRSRAGLWSENQQPKDLFRTGSKENINTNGDSFLVIP